MRTVRRRTCAGTVTASSRATTAAADRHYVVFVEVKLRASDWFVRAGAYVTPAKQARIRTAASLWLAEHETELQPRFDVIEIYGDADTPRRQRRINQIENAFE